MSILRTFLAAAAVMACLPAASPPAFAAGFDARPVTIETHGGAVASITVTNPGRPQDLSAERGA